MEYNINENKDKEKIIDTEFVEVVDENRVSSNIRNNKKKKAEINTPTLVVLVILLSLVSGFLGSYVVRGSSSNYINGESGIIRSVAKLEETNSISGAVSKIYDAAVVVEVYKDDSLVSTGTGFVYKKADKKAYLMTNNHVLAEDGDIKVLFTNGKELEAEVVGSDVYSDIAVLSVLDSKEIVAAVLGDSEKSLLGDTVFTVGSPEGSDYAGTVTKGILSGKNRVVEVALSGGNTSDYYMDVLQTDAAINPGNSGGPICNISGEVIGITNMKLVSDTVEGMGFAIPIEDAIEVASILEEKGKVVRPYLGIEMLDLVNQFDLWKAGILLPEGVTKGVAVYKVVNDSPADEAGFEKGDIIVKLGPKNIDNLASFRYQLYKYNPGDEVEVVYLRNGKEKETTIKLGKGE